MFIATIAVGALLALAFFGAGGAKLAGVPAMRQSAEHLGFSFTSYRVIGMLEIVAAVGILLGLSHFGGVSIGVAAAAAIAILMLGAMVTHIRAGDPPAQWAPTVVLALIAGTYIALRLATA